jgi:hypothetical protein
MSRDRRRRLSILAVPSEVATARSEDVFGRALLLVGLAGISIFETVMVSPFISPLSATS